RLKVGMFKSPAVGAHPTLLVVLHGDAPFAKPDYQDRFASSAAARYPDLVVAAILRPGYTDPAGHTSEGERGATTGDNYNATNTDAIASAIGALRDRFHASRVVLAGHSGGAAISANILGRHPALASAALLVSCPCDVAKWRAHMLETTRFDGFKGPLATLSPVDLGGSVSKGARGTRLGGGRGDVAPPAPGQGEQGEGKAGGEEG